jgi:hypothetical protein
VEKPGFPEGQSFAIHHLALYFRKGGIVFIVDGTVRRSLRATGIKNFAWFRPIPIMMNGKLNGVEDGRSV